MPIDRLPAVLLAGVPEPVASAWASALRAVGHAVVLTDAGGSYRGDVVVIGPEVALDTPPEAIVARVRARPAIAALVLSTGRLDLAHQTFEARDGRAIALTTQEAALLQRLAAANGEPVDREVLLHEVWGYAVAVVTRSVDNTVARLRVKIERDPAAPEHLITERGSGYRLVGARPEAEAQPAPILEPVPPAPRALVGREALVAKIRSLLDEEALLVTLVGPPGCGKSAVALAALADRAALAPSDRSRLARITAPAGAVLLLDDLDPDLDGAARALPGLRLRGVQVLATSRSPIGVADERCVQVPPLEAEDARRLLALRTGHAASDRLVSWMEGSPLAIELSASVARLVSPEALVIRDPVDVLIAPHRRPERHQSWKDAVGWSWARLPAEQRACAAWASRRAAFSMEEAEIGAGEGAWRAVGALLAASLLVREGPHVRMTALVASAVRRLAGEAP